MKVRYLNRDEILPSDAPRISKKIKSHLMVINKLTTEQMLIVRLAEIILIIQIVKKEYL